MGGNNQLVQSIISSYLFSSFFGFSALFINIINDFLICCGQTFCILTWAVRVKSVIDIQYYINWQSFVVSSCLDTHHIELQAIKNSPRRRNIAFVLDLMPKEIHTVAKMSCLSTLATLAVALLLTAPSHGSDPCVAYSTLNNPFRSTGYVATAGVDPMICDSSLKTGWYRFINEVGGKMPETKMTKYHCGTFAPIWMSGSHPAVADDIVSRTACINYNGMSNGCLALGIKVKNCNDSYFVYYLVKPLGCPMAYCAGMFDNLRKQINTAKAEGFCSNKELNPRVPEQNLRHLKCKSSIKEKGTKMTFTPKAFTIL